MSSSSSIYSLPCHDTSLYIRKTYNAMMKEELVKNCTCLLHIASLSVATRCLSPSETHTQCLPRLFLHNWTTAFNWDIPARIREKVEASKEVKKKKSCFFEFLFCLTPSNIIMTTRLPFTKIVHNPTKPELVLANGHHFLVLNTR